MEDNIMTKDRKTRSSILPGDDVDILHSPVDARILSSLIHSIPLRIYAKDTEGTFIFANRDYCRNVGKPLSEILGKNDFDIHPADLAEKYRADDEMIMSSRTTRDIEESWQSIGGETSFIKVVKTPLVDSENPEKVLGTLGVFWDITDRKRVEIEREEERQLLRTLIDSIPSLIYVKDREGKFVIANKAIAEFMQAGSPEQLVGKDDFDYYTSDVASYFASKEKELIQTGEAVNDLVENFTYKGQRFWISTSKTPLRNIEGDIVGLVGVGHDITRIKLIEEQLRESEERYAAVVNQALEGIMLLEPESKRVLDTNMSFRRMLGYSKEELDRLLVYDFVVHDRSEVDHNLRKAIESEELVIGERSYRHKDGHIVIVEVSATLIRYGGQQAVLAVVRDISEKKAAEEERERLKEQLRQAQKFEALGTLAGGVAHDLNNILSGIVGYPELLMNKLPADSELRKPLSVIHDSGVRASTVVADLLTIARSAVCHKQVHNLNTLVQECIASPEFRELKSRHPGISYSHQLGGDQANILCSPVHIKKCLMNLVANGSEACGEHGDIAIRVIDNRTEESGEERQVVLEVADTGSGISPADIGHIFEPFYTRKEMGRSGTGLGLTVVWNTVSDHGGTVTVDSASSGTCFRLIFPQSTAAGGEESAPAGTMQFSENNERILVVDDEQVLRDIACQMLTQLGYRVDAVSSGEMAVEFVRKTPVDLLLIDMLMGPGMNGRMTFKAIRQLYPDIKALIVSGYSEDEDVQAALAAGAKGFVQKPYLMSRLSQAVKMALA